MNYSDEFFIGNISL